MFFRMGCVTVRALCLVMMVMVTMGVTETSPGQERADTRLRRWLTTRTRQRHDNQVTEDRNVEIIYNPPRKSVCF